MTLRECIADAEKNKVAIGHFNISNTEGLWGVFRAAKNLNVPVIIGVSEGERDFLGIRQSVALVRSLREQFKYPIFINADHTYSYDRVKEAIDAGFDAVIFDGAKLSLEENILTARKCVEYARSINSEIIVEGEIGYIGTSSKILDAIPEGVGIIGSGSLTKPEDAKNFVLETGVDLLAPSVGTFHGVLRTGVKPALDIERVGLVRKAAGVPLVLHGGSGNSKEDFTHAIEAGVSIVHINTEIRIAYRKGLELGLQQNPDEVAPYKFLKGSVASIEKVVDEKLKIFNRL